ncbi:MAG: DUF2865 domain-containing protein [Hyphomicrobiaceae bacterium]|nr:DUF2865 domain-containing protein [Hyphomicrobiaceae bacterium]
MQKHLRFALLCAACVSTVMLISGAGSAQAQGFFPWSWGRKPPPPPPAETAPTRKKTAPSSRQGGGRPGGGTYRTLCVRTCDGFFFPISFKAGRSKFKKDSEACAQQCGSIGRLFVHRNPGQKVSSAVDLDGKRYVDLENAFRYRKEFVPGCDCKGASFPAPAFETTAEENRGDPALKTFPEDGGAAPRADKLQGKPGSGDQQ